MTASIEEIKTGDYSFGKVDQKEITLSGDGGQEKVEIHQKPSLFSEHFKASSVLVLVKIGKLKKKTMMILSSLPGH